MLALFRNRVATDIMKVRLKTHCARLRIGSKFNEDVLIEKLCLPGHRRQGQKGHVKIDPIVEKWQELRRLA